MVYVFVIEIHDQKKIFYSSGAIRRMAVEKEPSISYESFVNELDTGDSFTLSLVDILVKVRRYLNHFLAALIANRQNRNSLIDEPEQLSAIADSLPKTQ
jgi:hypothetical protein